MVPMKRLPTFLLIATLTACTSKTDQPGARDSSDAEFKKIHDAYVIEFLKRNPTVNTYLGGAGPGPALKEVDGKLRDHSSGALQSEDTWLTNTQKSLDSIDPQNLTPDHRIDRDV